MAEIDYIKLYKLQDEVFSVIFSYDNIFYLTGGTCISRFYFEKRYSDDLDFFADNADRFSMELRKIQSRLRMKFKVNSEIEGRDFSRIIVDDILQVDFINDRVERYKDIIILKNKYRIDNIENILINKITAIMGRDNPKDIFDLYLISKSIRVNWKEMIEFAMKKMFFNREDFIYRLKSFPVDLLESIKLTDEDFFKNFKKNFNKLVEHIVDEM